MRHHLVAGLVLAFTMVVGGCGDASTVSGERAEHEFDGPLYTSRGEAEHPSAGAAGDIVECDTWGTGGFSDAAVYGEGATANSPEKALKVARSERLFGGVPDGLRVAKQEEDRVLYVLEVRGVVKEAVIVRNGPATKGAGGDGWYVESWARCDYSELPRSFADSVGLQIWSDSSERPLPTTTIQSWSGPEHCNWQSMTFLYLGKAIYVRDPLPDLADFFVESYDEHARLPADAGDTGFERNGKHLWLSADKKRAFVGTPKDVEVWPRTIRPLGCA